MTYEKYLPIGTVLMLKGGKKRVMITGFCIVSNKDKEAVYDYCGCMYPEGTIKTEQILLFNHDQIDKIYYLGLIDEEEKAFKNKLKEIIEKIDFSKTKEIEEQTNTEKEDLEVLG